MLRGRKFTTTKKISILQSKDWSRQRKINVKADQNQYTGNSRNGDFFQEHAGVGFSRTGGVFAGHASHALHDRSWSKNGVRGFGRRAELENSAIIVILVFRM